MASKLLSYKWLTPDGMYGTARANGYLHANQHFGKNGSRNRLVAWGHRFTVELARGQRWGSGDSCIAGLDTAAVIRPEWI